MEKDVKEILDLADSMKKKFDKLELRQAFDADRRRAVKEAANTFRWFRDLGLTNLHAAFDPEYKEQMEKMTRAATR